MRRGGGRGGNYTRCPNFSSPWANITIYLKVDFHMSSSQRIETFFQEEECISMLLQLLKKSPIMCGGREEARVGMKMERGDR